MFSSITMKQRGTNSSELPESLLQHIQSFLPTKDGARSSLLSDSWLRAWSTRSFLDFDQSFFRTLSNKQIFFEYVNNTLSRYEEQGLWIEKFRLQIKVKSGDIASLVDKWLVLVQRNKVQELNLIIEQHGGYPRYLLPHFASKSLTVLELYNLEFTQFIHCPNLRKLVLVYVDMDVYTLQCMGSGFPLLEEFHLSDCLGLRKIWVANLLTLKIFSCNLTFYVGEEVRIEAPNLQYFKCHNFNKFSNSRLSIEPYRNLRCFSLSSNKSLTDTGLRNLLSECPLLEDLSLYCCYLLERIHVASHSLKRLALRSYVNKVVEVTIDAPNLCFLDYRGYKLSYLSLVAPPAQAQAQASATIRTRYKENLDEEWFGKLGSLLKRFKTSSLALCAIIPDTKEFIAAPPSSDHEIEALKLSVENVVSFPFRVLVSGLFSTCHPKTILVSWDNYQAEFIQCLCKELLCRRRINHWGVNQVRFWWHYLEDAKLEILSKTRGKWIQFDRKRFLAASMNLEHGTEIQFTFKWCTAEEY